MIYRLVREVLELVMLRAIRQQTAVVVQNLWHEELAHRLTVKVDRAQIAAALDKTQYDAIRLCVQRGRLARFRRLGKKSLIGLNRLAGAAKGPVPLAGPLPHECDES